MADQEKLDSNPTPSHDSDRDKGDSTHVVFLAYHKAVLARIGDLVAEAHLKDLLTITAGNLAKREGVQGDIAIAVLGRRRYLQTYKHDVAFLKLVRKIPVVIALIDQTARKRAGGSEDDAIAEDALAENVKPVRLDDGAPPPLLVDEEDVELADITADRVIQLPMPPDEFEKIIKTYIAEIKIDKSKEGATPEVGGRSRPLGEILVEANLITPLQLKKALEYQKGTRLRIGDALVELGYIDDEQKTQFLARQLGVPAATPKQFASADANVVSLIPEHIARQHQCIGLEKDGEILSVAMVDVLDLRLLDNLRDITELTVKPVLGSADNIQTSIDRYYKDIASQASASTLLADLGTDVEVIEQKDETIDIEKAAAEGAELGIIKLVNMLISNAIRDRASDIHIEPAEKELVVRYRIDGEMRRAMSPPQHSHQAIVTRIKILSNPDIAERRLPQDGRTVVRIGNREVDIRVSVLPTVFGEKVVMRILDKEAFEKSTANLGFTSHDLNTFRAQISKPYGMIIVTGPTGSGKSTTLYSAMQAVKSVTKNIITVEEPVEFHMDGLSQVNVNTKIGLTFASALRSILRQDPDIILIGEIRDEETADIAIKMALTGHLVFSTLHTNDAASSIARFVDIGVPPLLLGSSLNLVVAQRLVRTICTKCKIEFTPGSELLEELNLESKENMKFYKGEGCVSCNGTGYSGRTGLFEMIPVTRDVRTLIIRNASTPEIQALAEKEGMRTLRQAGIDLAIRGHTTIEQVIAVTTER